MKSWERIKKLVDTKYRELTYLGSGIQGLVFKAIKFDNTTVAIKVGDDLDKEIEILEILKDGCEANLVSCYYQSYRLAIPDKPEMDVIEMEYIDGWTIGEFINLKAKTLDEAYYYLLLITMDVMKAVRYIYSKGILHNDLHIGNILINKRTFVPKVIDFGEAVHKGEKSGDYLITSYDDINLYRGTLLDVNAEMIAERFPLEFVESKNSKLFKRILFGVPGIAEMLPDDIINLIENNIVKPSTLIH